MLRLCLALLLAWTLWPSPGAASPLASGSEHHVLRRSAVEYAPAAAHSVGGLELLSGLGIGAPRGAGHRVAGRCGDAPDGGCRSAARLRPRVPTRVLLARPGSGDAGKVCAPVCERLPYHATAPPSPR